MTRAGVLRGVALAILVVGSAGCSLVANVTQPGTIRDGWSFPTAALLPAGARSIPLTNTPLPDSVEPNMAFGCPLALYEPVRLDVDRSTDPPTLHFIGSSTEAHLTWTWGISAREVDGRVEVVLPDGRLIVREGEMSVMTLSGGYVTSDDSFEVCLTNPVRVSPAVQGQPSSVVLGLGLRGARTG